MENPPLPDAQHTGTEFRDSRAKPVAMEDPMTDLYAINLHLQERLEGDRCKEVRAAEAAVWLDDAGLLRDYKRDFPFTDCCARDGTRASSRAPIEKTAPGGFGDWRSLVTQWRLSKAGDGFVGICPSTGTSFTRNSRSPETPRPSGRSWAGPSRPRPSAIWRTS